MSEALRSIERWPRMLLPDDRWLTLVAFILGYDVASGGSFLNGFQEWVATRLGCPGSSLAWFALLAGDDGTSVEFADRLSSTDVDELRLMLVGLLREYHDLTG